MSILISKYEFDDPINSIEELQEKPGLYGILHFEDGLYELIHISEAENIREQIQLSPITDTSSPGRVLIVAFYTPNCGARERRRMVMEIDKEFEDEDLSELADSHWTVPEKTLVTQSAT